MTAGRRRLTAIEAASTCCSVGRVEGLSHERITAALWTRVQERMIAVEGELISRDGRLGGRVDLLLNEVDDAGETVAWVVADLKTGRTPEGKLKPELTVNFASTATFCSANNPSAPNVRAKAGTR